MRKIILVVIVIMNIFFLGCTSSQKQETQINCLDYCQNQQHTQCIGQWKIDGNYPACNCNYECVATQNNTIPANTTNDTVVIPIPIQQPANQTANNTQTQNNTLHNNSIDQSQLTVRTLNQTLTSHQEKIRNDFYRSGFDGSFVEQISVWSYNPEQNAPNEITITPPNAPKVRKNSILLNGIRAMSNIEYTDQDSGTKYEYAIVVFQTNTSLNLDSSDDFDIQFGGGRLVGCMAYFIEDYQDNNRIRYSAYDLKCGELRRT